MFVSLFVFSIVLVVVILFVYASLHLWAHDGGAQMWDAAGHRRSVAVFPTYDLRGTAPRSHYAAFIEMRTKNALSHKTGARQIVLGGRSGHSEGPGLPWAPQRVSDQLSVSHSLRRIRSIESPVSTARQEVTTKSRIPAADLLSQHRSRELTP